MRLLFPLRAAILALVLIAPSAQAEKVLRYSFLIAETGFDPAQINDLYSSVIVAAQEDAELDVPRPVEAELVADGVDLLLARHLAGEDLRRVAAEKLEQEKNQQDHARERGHHLPKPA